MSKQLETFKEVYSTLYTKAQCATDKFAIDYYYANMSGVLLVASYILSNKEYGLLCRFADKLTIELN